ncbi:MAG TPA: hypothetical protein VGD74_04200, partial [Vulgatibacter sp.]
TELGAGDGIREVGARALPPLWYEVRRDGSEWLDVGDVGSWLDEEAPEAIIREMEAVAVADRYRGFADLKLAAPISFEPQSAPLYEVRTVSDEVVTDAAEASGYRGFVDLGFQWKRGFGEDLGAYVDVEGATEVDSFDLNPALDVSVSWVLEVSNAGEHLAFSKPSAAAMVSGFDDVSASWGFACGVRSFDKRAVCWSPGAQQPAIVPRPPTLERFEYVRAGRSHACGLAQDKAIVCWGDGSASATPSQLDEYESLTVGSEHNCAIQVNEWKAICWGNDDRRQTRVPQNVNFSSLSAGDAHTCGIRSDKRVICWGDDSDGAAPAGPSSESYFAISAGGRSTSGDGAANAGGSFTCGILDRTRELKCWGSNKYGILQVPSGSFDSVTAGAEHACAIRSGTKTMVCWGRDSVGETPVDVGDEPMRVVSAGNMLTCGIGAVDRKARCWGAASPPPSREAFSAIAAGTDHACAIRKDDGKLFCWGSDSNDRVPREPTAGSFLSLSAGAESVCAIRAGDRAAVCWGGKEEDELKPPVTLGGFTSVAAGKGFACGLGQDDRKVVCWGPESPIEPMETRDATFTAIAAGKSFVCGVKESDRSISCWGGPDRPVSWIPGSFVAIGASAGGDNVCAIGAESRLASCWMDGGLGPEPKWMLPFPLKAMGVGVDHICGLDDEGRSFCAGSDGKGQLGTRLPPGLRLETVTAGNRFTCGLKAENGRRVCWGDNWYGQAPVSEAIP